MKIRRVSIDHYEEIIKLWERAGLPHKPKGRDSKRAMSAQMKRDPDLFLGAFEDGELVGVVIGTYDGRKGWINRLAVVPDYRRRGIGKALVQFAEKALRRKGASVICALVENWNSSSLSFFAACGYAKHPDISYFSKRESQDV